MVVGVEHAQVRACAEVTLVTGSLPGRERARNGLFRLRRFGRDSRCRSGGTAPEWSEREQGRERRVDPTMQGRRSRHLERARACFADAFSATAFFAGAFVAATFFTAVFFTGAFFTAAPAPPSSSATSFFGACAR